MWVRVITALGDDVWGRGTETVLLTLTPPATSFLPTRHGPKGCYVHLLGNLSPFILDPRRERTDLSLPVPDFRIPSRHLRSSPGTVPTPGAQLSSQGLSGFGKLQPGKGGKKAEAGDAPRAGKATLQRAMAVCKDAGRLKGLSIACTELVTVAV